MSLKNLCNSMIDIISTREDQQVLQIRYNVQYNESDQCFRSQFIVYYLLSSYKDHGYLKVEGMVLLPKNKTEGAFARGDMKGTRVKIVQYDGRLNPTDNEDVRREVNLLKLKNKTPKELNCSNKLTRTISQAVEA